MGSENAATPIFSFATPERLKSFNGNPQNLYAVVSKEALGFTASCLEDRSSLSAQILPKPSSANWTSRSNSGRDPSVKRRECSIDFARILDRQARDFVALLFRI
jgi:hypothetical protein